MLWKGQVLWGMMVYTTTYVPWTISPHARMSTGKESEPLVYPWEGTMAWWTAALEPRVKVLCGHLLSDRL